MTQTTLTHEEIAALDARDADCATPEQESLLRDLLDELVCGRNELDQYQHEADAIGLPGPHTDRHFMVAALGLAGEAGEVADLYKKQYEQDRAIGRDALVKELGDVLWYIARIGALEGISLSEIASANLAKLRARYPNGFVPGGGVR